MDTEHRVTAELLALKDAPDDALVDQVLAIGVTATRYMLFDEADRLQHTDQRTAMACIALVDRINALIRPAYSAYGVVDCRQIRLLVNPFT